MVHPFSAAKATALKISSLAFKEGMGVPTTTSFLSDPRGSFPAV